MADTFRFQSTLEALQSELKQAVSQRDELEHKIAGLRQSVTGLLRLRDASFDEDEPPEGFAINTLYEAATNVPDFTEALTEALGGRPPKLTEACRSTLKSATHPLTAGDIRRELEVMGFDFTKYTSNPLSAIHTTMKRDRLIRSFKNQDGKTVFEYLRSVPIPSSIASRIGDQLMNAPVPAPKMTLKQMAGGDKPVSPPKPGEFGKKK